MAIIREYRPDDQERVEQCIIELQDFERALKPDCVEGVTIVKRYFHDLLEECVQKNGRVFVAEVQNEVAGFVSVRIEHDWDTYLSSITDHAYISDLVVLPAYRTRGLGTALMQKAEEFARLQGAIVLKIEVLAKNQKAIDVYQDVGFRSYELVLLKELVPKKKVQ